MLCKFSVKLNPILDSEHPIWADRLHVMVPDILTSYLLDVPRVKCVCHLSTYLLEENKKCVGSSRITPKNISIRSYTRVSSFCAPSIHLHVRVTNKYFKK